MTNPGIFKLLLEEQETQDEKKPNVCTCNVCYQTFRISQCEFEPTYEPWDCGLSNGGCHLCPVCEDGGEIFDYDYHRVTALVECLGQQLKKGQRLCSALAFWRN